MSSPSSRPSPDWSRHKAEFFGAGLTVFQGLLPPSLVDRLRAEADKARILARKRSGPQAQRLQPVYKAVELEQGPFEEFHALPILRQAVAEILGPRHERSRSLGILFEPSTRPWCTTWHRDWFHVARLDLDEFAAACANLKMFSQLNAPLYDDGSLWLVPGSHSRRDTPGEASYPRVAPEPPPAAAAPEASGAPRSDAEIEVSCRDYCEAMPGAVQLHLKAGDLALYRASAWHLGNYLPYAKRATLHDGFYGPDDRAWHRRMKEIGAISQVLP